MKTLALLLCLASSSAYAGTLSGLWKGPGFVTDYGTRAPETRQGEIEVKILRSPKRLQTKIEQIKDADGHINSGPMGLNAEIRDNGELWYSIKDKGDFRAGLITADGFEAKMIFGNATIFWKGEFEEDILHLTYYQMHDDLYSDQGNFLVRK